MSYVRLEIIIDKLGAKELFRLIRPFKQVTCTVHRALACQSQGHLVTTDDLSDSISYHLVLLFFPKELYSEIKTLLKKHLPFYSPSVYESFLEEPKWFAQ